VLVGVADGSTVGSAVGEEVGDAVGEAVGLDVGSVVGLASAVGAAEGTTVGVGVTTVFARVVVPPEPATDPRLVPALSEPPTTLAIGLPTMPSTPVRTPNVVASTATAATEIRAQGSLRGGRGASGAFGSTTGASEAGRTRDTVLCTTYRVRLREDVYIALTTVAITLATAAPMIVPATPR